jgi:hypothetical protein
MASLLLGNAACQSGTATGLMVIMAVLASTAGGSAADLKPETLAAFDKYIRLKEARLEQPHASGSLITTRALNFGLYCFLVVVIDLLLCQRLRRNLNLLPGLKSGVHYRP